MEILIIISIVLVLVLILGQSFLPLMVLLLWVMEIFAVLCVVFFLVMMALAVAARPKKASFVEVDKDDKGIGFAFYEIEGKEYPNTFPTDAFLRKMLYRKKDVKVRVLKIGKGQLLFDKLTLWIIGIGLPAFGILSYLVFELIRMA